MYDLEIFLPNLNDPPPKNATFKANILTKITKYWESKLRKDAQSNSKMKCLNVNLIGLSGRCHPALCNFRTAKQVSRMCPHIKMLCDDYYTHGRFFPATTFFCCRMYFCWFCNRSHFLSCNKNFMKIFVHSIWLFTHLDFKFESNWFFLSNLISDCCNTQIICTKIVIKFLLQDKKWERLQYQQKDIHSKKMLWLGRTCH